MPQKQADLKGQLRYAQSKRNQIWEEREAGMRPEKFLPHWKKLGMQNFLYPRQIDFSVFRERMIPMNQNSAHSEER
jgi:hypothetical protein